MAINVNLSKGMKIDLTKEVPGLKKVRATLKWHEAEQGKPQADADLTVMGLAQKQDADLSIVALGDGTPNRKIFSGSADWIIFYNTPDSKLEDGTVVKASPNKEIIHWGDNRDGGFHNGIDGEQADIDLSNMPEGVVEVVILGTIYEGQARNQNWNQLGATLEIQNVENDEIIASYKLEKDFPTQTTIHVGSFVRTGPNKWEFAAVGQGNDAGLEFYINAWS